MHDFFNRDILGYYRENNSWKANQFGQFEQLRAMGVRGLELREVNADAKSIYFKHKTFMITQRVLYPLPPLCWML